MKRTAVRLGAATAATALVMLSSAPAHAATVSQASASALQIGIGGTPAEVTGEVVATNDGTGETVTGETNPPVSVLQNQALANVGVLAQEATARVATNGEGNSAACAGVAGNGGAVVGVGESQCITPGDPVGTASGSTDEPDSPSTESADPDADPASTSASPSGVPETSASTTPAAPPHPVSLPALAQKAFNGGDLRLGAEVLRTANHVQYAVTWRSGNIRVSGRLALYCLGGSDRSPSISISMCSAVLDLPRPNRIEECARSSPAPRAFNT